MRLAAIMVGLRAALGAAPGLPLMRAALAVAVMACVFVQVGSSATPAGGLPKLWDGGSAFKVRPQGINLAPTGQTQLAGYGAPQIYTGKARPFRALRWKTWTAKQATAAGAEWQDNCVPDCPTGTFIATHVNIRAWAPSRGRFTRLTITEAGQPPETLVLRLLNGSYYEWA